MRGLCVLLMVMDHALFDLGFLFFPIWFPEGSGSGLLYQLCWFSSSFYWHHPLRLIIRPLVVAGFIGICGICCSFSRSNLKRGLKLLGIALLLTLVTAAMDAVSGFHNYYIIRCGILHMLAASILLYALLQKANRLVPLFAGLLIVAVYVWQLLSPADLPGLVPYVLGLGRGSYSADYFPLIPYVGYFLIGAVLGTWLYREKRSYFPRVTERGVLRPVGFLGRHALWVYVLHQPLIYGLLWLIGLLR